MVHGLETINSMNQNQPSASENPASYKSLIEQLAKPADQIARDISAPQLHLVHMILGIAGEAGELLDAIKKNAIYQKPLDLENVIEELGDIEFYLEGLRQGLNISRTATLTHNYNKLRKRYGQSYSNQAAINRVDKQSLSEVTDGKS